MDWLKSYFGSVPPATGRDIVGTLVLLLVTVVLRTILRRAILRHVDRPEVRLRMLVNLRNSLLAILFLGLIFIWAQALQTFAVSLVALAVAFVIATKDLIQCVSGSILRTSQRVYSIGDRIEVSGFRGDVIDQGMFTTTLLEVGPGRSFHLHTGRTVVIPNSILLTSPVVNESAMEQYIVHVFPIPLRAGDDWRKAEKILIETANVECRPFLEEARRHMDTLEQRHGFSSPSVEPRVAVQLADSGRVELLVRVPAPVGRQGRIEQAVLRRFLEQFYPVDHGFRQDGQ